MSAFNANNAFSYSFPTSSINYVKNYNFNDSTTSNLDLVVRNLDKDGSITVNISTSKPWITIIDSASRQNVTYPTRNIILEKNTSRNLQVVVSLPPSIDSLQSARLNEALVFNIVSGSVPVTNPETQPPNNNNSSENTDSSSNGSGNAS